MNHAEPKESIMPIVTNMFFLKRKREKFLWKMLRHEIYSYLEV